MKKGNSLYVVFISVMVLVCACKKEYSCENCFDTGIPPVAVAGKDTSIILPLDSLLFDGSFSYDPDGTISSWKWSEISGPGNVIFRNSDSSQTIVAELLQGTYYMELKVIDNDGLVDRDTIQLNIHNSTSANHKPIAHAGFDKEIQLPSASVIMDGTGSADPDNNIIIYQWFKISGPAGYLISHFDSSITDITNLEAGTYQFKLRVIDATGLYDEDTVQVNVNPPLPTGNVHFFFRDTTGGVDDLGFGTMSFDNLHLAKVKITGYPEILIDEVFCLQLTPECPNIETYLYDLYSYGNIYGLPEGTYSWQAESIPNNFTNYYPCPPSFVTYWSTPHFTSGTVTVPPGSTCIMVEIVF